MCGTQAASAPSPYNEKAFKFKLKYVDLLMESAKAKTNSTTTLTAQRIFFWMTGNWGNYCETSPHIHQRRASTLTVGRHTMLRRNSLPSLKGLLALWRSKSFPTGFQSNESPTWSQVLLWNTANGWQPLKKLNHCKANQIWYMCCDWAVILYWMQ